MRLVISSPKNSQKPQRSPRWWERSTFDLADDEPHDQFFLPDSAAESKRVAPARQNPGSVAQIQTELPSETTPTPSIDRFNFYKFTRSRLVREHQETLLEPITQQVSLIRQAGINVFSVSQLNCSLILVKESFQGSFVIGTGEAFDIWLDDSATKTIATQLEIPHSHVLEVSLWHEAGHLLDRSPSSTTLLGSEVQAWVNARSLWSNHGKCPESSFLGVAVWALKSYGLTKLFEDGK